MEIRLLQAIDREDYSLLWIKALKEQDDFFESRSKTSHCRKYRLDSRRKVLPWVLLPIPGLSGR